MSDKSDLVTQIRGNVTVLLNNIRKLEALKEVYDIDKPSETDIENSGEDCTTTELANVMSFALNLTKMLDNQTPSQSNYRGHLSRFIRPGGIT